MNRKISAMVLIALSMLASMASARENADDIASLRHLVEEMRLEYEARITDLENRLAQSERVARSARKNADEAIEMAEQTAIDQSSGVANANAFNPALGAILTGRYADVGAGWDEIPGFQGAGEIGTDEPGFSLGEAEINLKASIDSKYYGNLTVGLHEDEGAVEVELEEAWVQTSDLPAGLSLRAGRLFSAAGYLNSFHFHSDDFADRPLPYQAFLGGRYSVDGVQARWVAPTPLFIELGTEFNWGDGFPATANHKSSAGAWTAFVKMGGDSSISNSWQLGLSRIHAKAIERGAGHAHEGDAHDDSLAFSGDSDLTVLDFVWKWAPQGNSLARNFKIQGEYFMRSENGDYSGSVYDGDQSGWYLQGVMQFAPRWRAGARYDLVDPDNKFTLDSMSPENSARHSKRSSVMLDWSASEFSRLRLQYTYDEVLPQSDHQWLLEYVMSIGAHGGHQF